MFDGSGAPGHPKLVSLRKIAPAMHTCPAKPASVGADFRTTLRLDVGHLPATALSRFRAAGDTGASLAQYSGARRRSEWQSSKVGAPEKSENGEPTTDRQTIRDRWNGTRALPLPLPLRPWPGPLRLRPPLPLPALPLPAPPPPCAVRHAAVRCDDGAAWMPDEGATWFRRRRTQQDQCWAIAACMGSPTPMGSPPPVGSQPPLGSPPLVGSMPKGSPPLTGPPPPTGSPPHTRLPPPTGLPPRIGSRRPQDRRRPRDRRRTQDCHRLSD